MSIEMPTSLSATGDLRSSIESPLTNFGEVATAQKTARVQVSFVYGLNSDLATTTITGSGSATATGGILRLSTTAAANSSARVQTRRFLKYSIGKGAVARCTATFTAGVAGSSQIIGYGSPSDGLFFGYNGTQFGIMHRKGGIRECRTLTVSSGAGGTESVTVNLGTGVAVTFNVSVGSATVAATAIAAQSYTGWTARQIGAAVVFVKDAAAATSGTFNLVNNSAGTCAGTMAATLAGAAPTETWVPQTEWNMDKCDGTGAFPVMDWTKGNVLEIGVQWLGFGQLTFSVENPILGRFSPVHRIVYANANTGPSLRNPSLPLMAESANTSNATSVVMDVCCLAGFIEGSDETVGPTYGIDNSVAGVGTSFVPLLSIRSPATFLGESNRVPVSVRHLSVSVDGSKPAIVAVYRNAALTGAVWQSVSAGASVMERDTTATATSGGTELMVWAMGKSDGRSIVLPEAFLDVYPGESITFVGKASTATTDAAAGITWQERF